MPKPRIYVGIDPGKSGGLVYISPRNLSGDYNKPRFIEVTPMPETERDIWDWFCSFPSGNAVAVIEWIHPAILGIGKSPMSKLYGNYMQLRGFLIARKISFEAIKTAEWCKGLGIPAKKKNETRTQWKNRLKARAQQLFPQLTVTLKTADALLVAEYCRRLHRGLLK